MEEEAQTVESGRGGGTRDWRRRRRLRCRGEEAAVEGRGGSNSRNGGDDTIGEMSS